MNIIRDRREVLAASAAVTVNAAATGLGLTHSAARTKPIAGFADDKAWNEHFVRTAQAS